MSDTISASAVGMVVVLSPAIRLAVRGRLVERVPLVIAVSSFPCLFTFRPFTARHLLVCVEVEHASSTDRAHTAVLLPSV